MSTNVTWHPGHVARADRPFRGATIWFTGLSGSGKSTVAVACEEQLVGAGRPAYVLDGDNIRHGLNGDLGFSAEDRAENVRRVGHVACLMADAGLVALVPLVSPYRADRDAVRQLHAAAGLPFVEVFVDTPIELCEQRDPKGLYAKARAGELRASPASTTPTRRRSTPSWCSAPPTATPAPWLVVSCRSSTPVPEPSLIGHRRVRRSPPVGSPRLSYVPPSAGCHRMTTQGDHR